MHSISSVVFCGLKKTLCFKPTFFLLLLLTLPACSQMRNPDDSFSTAETNEPASVPSESKCLLPGQVRMIHSKATFLAPRQIITESPNECKTRGGDVISKI